MPSGYEQSPNYGGPEPSWHGIIVTAVAIIIVVAAIVVMIAV